MLRVGLAFAVSQQPVDDATAGEVIQALSDMPPLTLAEGISGDRGTCAAIESVLSSLGDQRGQRGLEALALAAGSSSAALRLAGGTGCG